VGLSADRSLVVDVLHALHLGVMKTWVRVTIWHLLDAGVYTQGGSADESITRFCLACRNQLMAWYKRQQADTPTEVITRVHDFSPKMIGTRTRPRCKTKGAETWGLLLFFLSELRRFGAAAGDDGRRLRQAGEALEMLVRTWRSSPWILPLAARQDCLGPGDDFSGAFGWCLRFPEARPGAWENHHLLRRHLLRTFVMLR
jgi:hypothetical protein